MARRKGWDNLSDTYRNRLIRNGIGQSDYESGVVLHGARGKGTAANEKWLRDVNAFAHEYTQYRQTHSREQRPFPTTGEVRNYVKSLGRVEGEKYMREQRKMAKAYGAGKPSLARRLWKKRPDSRPEWMYYYHGVFGY